VETWPTKALAKSSATVSIRRIRSREEQRQDALAMRVCFMETQNCPASLKEQLLLLLCRSRRPVGAPTSASDYPRRPLINMQAHLTRPQTTASLASSARQPSHSGQSLWWTNPFPPTPHGSIRRPPPVELPPTGAPTSPDSPPNDGRCDIQVGATRNLPGSKYISIVINWHFTSCILRYGFCRPFTSSTPHLPNHAASWPQVRRSRRSGSSRPVM
jgi:hypothetical protein